ncbi:hypothetical protein D3C81_1757000 [compost metagenome]
MDAVTSTSTRIGATAFSAEMNTVPSRPTAVAPCGQAIANTMPANRPMTICTTRLGARKELERSVIGKAQGTQTPILSQLSPR